MGKYWNLFGRKQMHITYKNPGFQHSIDSILLFQTEDATPSWSDALFYFFPQLSKDELTRKDPFGQKEYLSGILADIYHEIKPELDEKVQKYNEHFLNYESQINDALSEAFDTDTRIIFNDLTGNICLNPICPRFLQERYFDVFYKNSERGALGLSLHEAIHFIWFNVWNRLFHDSYDEYETPSLKWILSEMAVESIMSDERLSSINPYYPRENGGCVYPYFQDMVIAGEPILDTLAGIYKQMPVGEYMQTAYEYCRMHEAAIRRHITESENR